MNLRESLAQSVNTYYFDLAMKLGIDRISADFDRMGFGKPTGIDLTGEAAGVLPSREWKQRRFRQAWFPGETVISGIGQGYWVTTPLQLAQGTAMLAGDGQLRRPHLVRATQAGFGAPACPSRSRPRCRWWTTPPTSPRSATASWPPCTGRPARPPARRRARIT